jgi:endonuclease/exonuclease/phosphatase family metal-dependent hydrolase
MFGWIRKLNKIILFLVLLLIFSTSTIALNDDANDTSVKLLYYNQVYGTDGNSLIPFLRTHLYHMLGQPEKVRERSNISDTVRLVRANDPDIFVLSEVLGETQREEFIQEMPEYHFYSGQGHGWNGSSQYVEILLGTRLEAQPLNLPRVEVPNKMGNGGGIVGVYLPTLDTYVLGLQLALQDRKEIVDQQMDIVKNYSDKKVILLGDFNQEYSELIKHYPWMKEVERLSPDVSTCSETNFVKWFYHRSLDYILGRGVNLQDKGTFSGRSDHKGVWVEITTYD